MDLGETVPEATGMSIFKHPLWESWINFIQYIPQIFRSMQTEMGERKGFKIQSIVVDNPIMPKSSSKEGFFSPKKRTYKNPMVSSTSNIFQSLNQLHVSSYLSPPSKIKDTISLSTMETNVVEEHLEFRKRKPKTKFNKIPQDKKNHSMPKINIKLIPRHFLPQKQKNGPHLKIDNFILLKKVGEGNYSTAYLALQKRIRFLCVLKMIKKSLIIQNQLQEVLTREIKIQQYLHHENIVSLYGFFHDEDNIYLISEYAPDGDLYKHMKAKKRENKPIQIKEISTIVKQICNAVLSMHVDYLMHRDIKPQNIFLSFGNVKLGDFGWSVYNNNKTLRDTKCGTPLYLAPQLIDQGSYSEAVDIWAIGVLTFEMLTGQLPFDIYSPRDLQKVVCQKIRFHQISNQTARDFVEKMLERDVRKRVEIEDVIDHGFLQLSTCSKK